MRLGNVQPVTLPLERQRPQSLNRVHAARRQKYHGGSMGPRGFQAMNGAGEVGVDDIGRTAAVARVHRRFCRALEQGVERSCIRNVSRIPDVAVDEVHSRHAQPRQRELAATPSKVVECADVPRARRA